MAFVEWADHQLGDIRGRGQWRWIRTFDGFGPSGAIDGKPVVSYASNDYLGLSTHPAVIDAAHSALDRWGASSTASRLVVGSRPIHDEVEAELSAWKRTDRALIFPTGYAANLGVLSTLGGKDCLVVSDELNHASIIDGCRLSRSKLAVVAHKAVDQVDAALTANALPRAIVVSDAVFSMDGDEAPVAELGEVCARHGALLVLDEAHSVFGPDVDALSAVEGLEVLRVVTLSKSLGALGGGVCGPASLIDLLINRGRTFIFSTALSPADAAAAAAAVRITMSPEGKALTVRLRGIVDRISPGHPSPIVPLIIGAEADAVAATERLLERGVLVPAIRPPTVAPGTSRLRVALSAGHTDAMIDTLVAELSNMGLLR